MCKSFWINSLSLTIRFSGRHQNVSTNNAQRSSAGGGVAPPPPPPPPPYFNLKCKGYFSSASKHVLLNYSLIILLIYYFAHIKLFSHYYVSIIFKLLIVESWYPTRRKVDWCRYHFTLANARQFYSSRREHLITNELNEGCFPSFNLVIRISLVRKVNPIWQCSFRRWLIMITIG